MGKTEIQPENITSSSHENTNNNSNTVEIILKTIGPGRPSRLTIPSPIKVRELRKLVAEKENLSAENLRLISRGSALHDSKNREEVYIQLTDGDTLIVAVRPKAPPKHLQAGYDDEDDEDDLKFELPESTSRWKWKLFCILRDKLKLPDIVLIAVFSLTLKAWALIVLWFILAPVAHRWELGPLYILGTGFAIIFLNLGHRQTGELSAYSIFNEDFRELPGTLNADRLDRDMRTGQL